MNQLGLKDTFNRFIKILLTWAGTISDMHYADLL